MADAIINVFDLPVHPQADIYPMLPKDEMAELVESIINDGLQQPLTIGEVKIGDAKAVMMLIDGRNRREACRIAEVEPTTTALNGTDATDFIAASNLNRRHMTKSQRAMAMAMHYPEPEKGGRGKKSVKSTEFSDSYLSKARKVYRLNKSLAAEVLAGTPLGDAYKQVCADEASAADVTERLKVLRDRYSDLAEMVDTGRLSFEGAEAEATQRDITAKKVRDDKFQSLYQLNNVATVIRSDDHIDAVAELFAEYSGEFEKFTQRTLAEYLKTIKVVEGNIGKLKTIIEETIDGTT